MTITKFTVIFNLLRNLSDVSFNGTLINDFAIHGMSFYIFSFRNFYIQYMRTTNQIQIHFKDDKLTLGPLYRKTKYNPCIRHLNYSAVEIFIAFCEAFIIIFHNISGR